MKTKKLLQKIEPQPGKLIEIYKVRCGLASKTNPHSYCPNSVEVIASPYGVIDLIDNGWQRFKQQGVNPIWVCPKCVELYRKLSF